MPMYDPRLVNYEGIVGGFSRGYGQGMDLGAQAYQNSLALKARQMQLAYENDLAQQEYQRKRAEDEAMAQYRQQLVAQQSDQLNLDRQREQRLYGDSVRDFNYRQQHDATQNRLAADRVRTDQESNTLRRQQWEYDQEQNRVKQRQLEEEERRNTESRFDNAAQRNIAANTVAARGRPDIADIIRATPDGEFKAEQWNRYLDDENGSAPSWTNGPEWRSMVQQFENLKSMQGAIKNDMVAKQTILKGMYSPMVPGAWASPEAEAKGKQIIADLERSAQKVAEVEGLMRDANARMADFSKQQSFVPSAQPIQSGAKFLGSTTQPAPNFMDLSAQPTYGNAPPLPTTRPTPTTAPGRVPLTQFLRSPVTQPMPTNVTTHPAEPESVARDTAQAVPATQSASQQYSQYQVGGVYDTPLGKMQVIGFDKATGEPMFDRPR